MFSGHRYTSLEAPDTRARALSDTRGFLSAGDSVILDEIQRAPELLSSVQALADEDPRRPGRFIVTGSQNILLMESVSQTLAGRTALLRLHPWRNSTGCAPGARASWTASPGLRRRRR